jgi:AraC family transcriptional regulator
MVSDTGGDHPKDRTTDPRNLSGTQRRRVRVREWEIVETEHAPGSSTGWHLHAVPHFCLVVAGSVLEESVDPHRPAGPGSLLFFPADAPHNNRFPAPGARCLNVRVRDARLADGALDRASAGCPLWLSSPEASRTAGRLYDRLCVGDRDGAEALLPELLDCAVRSITEPASDGPPWVTLARNIVENRWDDIPQLSRVADLVGVDRHRLAREFRRRYGCSVGEYRHWLQVQQAKHELLTTDAPLASIAFRTGFSDQSHFTRLFKRYTRMTPATFRRIARGGSAARSFRKTPTDRR